MSYLTDRDRIVWDWINFLSREFTAPQKFISLAGWNVGMHWTLYETVYF